MKHVNRIEMLLNSNLFHFYYNSQLFLGRNQERVSCIKGQPILIIIENSILLIQINKISKKYLPVVGIQEVSSHWRDWSIFKLKKDT